MSWLIGWNKSEHLHWKWIRLYEISWSKLKDSISNQAYEYRYYH